MKTVKGGPFRGETTGSPDKEGSPCEEPRRTARGGTAAGGSDELSFWSVQYLRLLKQGQKKIEGERAVTSEAV